jgi:hypothetical protein
MRALHGSLAICTGPAGSQLASQASQPAADGTLSGRFRSTPTPGPAASRQMPPTQPFSKDGDRQRRGRWAPGERAESWPWAGRAKGGGGATTQQLQSSSNDPTHRRRTQQASAVSAYQHSARPGANPSAATHRMRLTQCSNMQLCNHHPASSTSVIVAAVIAASRCCG